MIPFHILLKTPTADNLPVQNASRMTAKPPENTNVTNKDAARHRVGVAYLRREIIVYVGKLSRAAEPGARAESETVVQRQGVAYPRELDTAQHHHYEDGHQAQYHQKIEPEHTPYVLAVNYLEELPGGQSVETLGDVRIALVCQSDLVVIHILPFLSGGAAELAYPSVDYILF